MSITELGALGEFIGSILVAVSLIALIFQIRQNTRSLDESRKLAMAQAYQDRGNATVALAMNFALSPELVEIQDKLNTAGYPEDPNCVEVLTSRERLAFARYALAQKVRVDNQFYQYQQGLIDEEFFQSLFRPQVLTFGPAWNMLTIPGRPSFQKEIDRILAEPHDEVSRIDDSR